MNYYNEIDRFSCDWLEQLMRERLIPEGLIDERSIEDVTKADLKGFKQCHFFAGIGGWSYALAIAGWPESKQVWTGSCPCQPFSKGGKLKGFDDERHLWPALHHLICECRPEVVLGEQVSSKAGYKWADLVSTDLDSEDYTVGFLDLCAASALAPQPRQRLFWAAKSNGHIHHGERRPSEAGSREVLAQRQSEETVKAWARRKHELVADGTFERFSSYPKAVRSMYGIPGYMGQMRGFGNAIVPQVAAEFIGVASEVMSL